MINTDQWILNEQLKHVSSLSIHKGCVFFYSPKSSYFFTSDRSRNFPSTTCKSPSPTSILKIFLLKNKLLWTGNFLLKGYPALWYLKYCAFLLICHWARWFFGMCNVGLGVQCLWGAGQSLPTDFPTVVAASHLQINQLLQISLLAILNRTVALQSKEKRRNIAFQHWLSTAHPSAASPDKVL